ncbi:MAG: hypothetical protein QNK40_07220 [Desulfobacterales bacterium]|nr:hypothetical protein [Desulfobacterales bacterium]
MKAVRVNAPHVDTQPNIYYREGTRLLDWAVTPTLPGNVHMDQEFWENTHGDPCDHGREMTLS